MPEVVIVDEIGTEAEALACRSIAERGVQLIGTAHGQILENLMKNPTLSDLIGGIQSVTLGAQPAMGCRVQMGRRTSHVMPAQADERPSSRQLALLCNQISQRPAWAGQGQAVHAITLSPHLAASAGDDEARARGTQKTVLERVAPPTFPLVIEMRERAYWVTHWVEDSVDCLLHGKVPIVQARHPHPPGHLPPAQHVGGACSPSSARCMCASPAPTRMLMSYAVHYCCAICGILLSVQACTAKSIPHRV